MNPVRIFRVAGLLAFLAMATRSIGAPATAPADRFEKEIAAFEAADRTQPPPKDAVLFIGSSSIRLWKSLAADFPNIAVINRGFGGSQIADSTRYADRIVIPYHPRRVVFYAGDNDLAVGKPPETLLADFEAFVTKVHSELPDVPISYISIKPSPLRWKLVDKMRKANALIEAYIKSGKNLDYIDVFTPMLGPDGQPRPELYRPDHLHMVAKGYELWTSIIAPRLVDPPTTTR